MEGMLVVTMMAIAYDNATYVVLLQRLLELLVTLPVMDVELDREGFVFHWLLTFHCLRKLSFAGEMIFNL